MDFAEYRQLLRHPKWQRKRLRIFNRDNWKCVACGADDQELHVHHNYYADGKRPWEYADEDLITFCFLCHERFHYAESCEGIVIPWQTWATSEGTEIEYGSILLFEGHGEDRDGPSYLFTTFNGDKGEISCGSAALFENPGLKGMHFVKWALSVQALCMAKWETEDPAACVIQGHETIHVSI